jgi:hypothetical protein
MTAETHIQPPGRRARRAAASLLALSLVATAGAACAQEADSGGGGQVAIDGGGEAEGTGGSGGSAEFAATAEFLQETAAKTAAESHSIEVRIGLGEVADSAPPAMTGEFDGTQSHVRMDLAVIMEEVTAGMGVGDTSDVFGDTDMTMETISDGDTLYVRAPFFATLGEMMPTGATPGADELAALGDGWGSVSIAGLGEALPEDVAASIAGQQSFNPRAAVEMMENAEGVVELGTEEIDGVTQRGLRADVTFADLIRTSGMDPETYAETAGADTEAMMGELIDMRMPVEVWVDDDGYLRTLTYTLSMGDLIGAMGEDLPGGAGLGDMDFVYAIRFADYGADFSFETPSGATDITDAFAEIYNG